VRGYRRRGVLMSTDRRKKLGALLGLWMRLWRVGRRGNELFTQNGRRHRETKKKQTT